MNIQWYPGHMTKAKRQLITKLKLIDMVIEVLDARAPKSSDNPDFDELFKNKLKFYVLNKADLADPKITEQWIKKFQSEGHKAIAFSATEGNIKTLKAAIADNAKNFLNKYKEKGVNKVLRGLIAGIPNVGKTAILNRLLGTKKLTEGNKPGVTKSLQWAKIDPYLEIMDSPGLLWPKFENDETGAVIALIGSINNDILNEEELAFYLIKLLKETEPQLLIDRYKLDGLNDDAYQVLCEICKKRGFLYKGGEYDIERGAKTLLDEFKNGKLGRVSLEKPE